VTDIGLRERWGLGLVGQLGPSLTDIGLRERWELRLVGRVGSSATDIGLRERWDILCLGLDFGTLVVKMCGTSRGRKTGWSTSISAVAIRVVLRF